MSPKERMNTKIVISIKPNKPKETTLTAQGNKNTASMSNTTKAKAKR